MNVCRKKEGEMIKKSLALGSLILTLALMGCTADTMGQQGAVNGGQQQQAGDVFGAFAQGIAQGLQNNGAAQGAEDVPNLANVLQGAGTNTGADTGTNVAAGTNANGTLNVPLFNQNAVGAARPWAYCGPTSVKMVLAYFGINKDVNECARGVYIPGQGAGHEGMAKKFRDNGLNAELTYGNSIAWLRQQTAAGNPVVVGVKGNYGPRSTNGHILVVTGVTPSGQVCFNDPAGGRAYTVAGSTFNRAWSNGSGGRMAIPVSGTRRA